MEAVSFSENHILLSKSILIKSNSYTLGLTGSDNFDTYSNTIVFADPNILRLNLDFQPHSNTT